MDNIREKILEILTDMHPDEDIEHCNVLVDEKVLDSFDIVTLIASISDEFDVAVTADKIVAENFNSVEALCRMIAELMDEE